MGVENSLTMRSFISLVLLICLVIFNQVESREMRFTDFENQFGNRINTRCLANLSQPPISVEQKFVDENCMVNSCEGFYKTRGRAGGKGYKSKLYIKFEPIEEWCTYRPIADDTGKCFEFCQNKAVKAIQ